MKHHEREFFISMIRSGKLFISLRELELEIRPLFLDQVVKSCIVYQKAYEKSLSENMMTEEEVQDWMIENELWTIHDDKLEESLKKDIEKLKIEIYNSRSDKKAVNKIRLYLRAAESKLSSQLNKKFMYHHNTCEGVASAERLVWILKQTTYKDNKLYDFTDISVQNVADEWQSSFLSEQQCRELARNDPWKSTWVTRESSGISLFANPPNTDLTYNQKNLLIWSQMYDNIQESLECPDKNVIDDDDMLDGWFILQAQKREKEKLEREFESEVKNEKIKNSSEVYVMSNSQEKNDKINKMNSPFGNMIKQQRQRAIQSSGGSIDEANLPDKRLELQMMATNQSVRK